MYVVHWARQSHSSIRSDAFLPLTGMNDQFIGLAFSSDNPGDL